MLTVNPKMDNSITVLKAAAPPRYNMPLLRDEVLAAFQGRAVDCNEIEFGVSLACYVAKPLDGDQALFEATIAAHNPDAKDLLQQRSDAEEAAHATLKTLQGKTAALLSPDERDLLTVAILQTLGWADASGLLTTKFTE